MLLEFQSSAFDRSAISPKTMNATGRAALNLCTDWNCQFQSSALLRTLLRKASPHKCGRSSRSEDMLNVFAIIRPHPCATPLLGPPDHRTFVADPMFKSLQAI
jgi:hypothetical protein